MTPDTALAWPLFTAEAKSPLGKEYVSDLQNQYNGAVMVNNILQLKRAVVREDSFFDMGLVFTMSVNMYQDTLRVHWASRAANGTITYLAQELRRWGMSQSHDARRCMFNIIGWIQEDVAQKWIFPDLEILEARLEQIDPNGVLDFSEASLQSLREPFWIYPSSSAPTASGCSTSTVSSAKTEYRVERILDKRFRGKRAEYKVKWLGYAAKDSTWESSEAFSNAMGLIQDFENSVKGRSGRPKRK